jgi:general secretion pathway protein A
MYQKYFGFVTNPFELSPDPSFFFSSEKSVDALAAISYAISRRKGFIVMTGEVGTGKTLLLRCLLELWEREQIRFAYFIGPKLSTMDFLQYMTVELEIRVPNPTKGTLLRALYGFLLAQFERDLTTILIIDEAHQIPQGVLEEIRLLANFETAQQKLLQVLLVGQPELDKKLDSIELRSLKQRIAVRCQLEPLRPEETLRYIQRRLELAGAGSLGATIFPPDTIQLIHHYSLGIPRLINCICDQALMSAYARKVLTVPIEIISEVALRFRLSHDPELKRTEMFSPKSRIARSTQDGFLQSRSSPAEANAGAPDSDAATKAFGSGQQQFLEERIAQRARYR